MAFLDYRLWGLPRGLSNHCPLVPEARLVNWGPKPFRFFDYWLMVPGFVKMVEAWRSSWASKFVGSCCLVDKLEALHCMLKQWSKSLMGNLPKQIEAIKANIDKVDLELESDPSNSGLKCRRRFLKAELWRSSKLSESYWRQQSRIT